MEDYLRVGRGNSSESEAQNCTAEQRLTNAADPQRYSHRRQNGRELMRSWPKDVLNRKGRFNGCSASAGSSERGYRCGRGMYVIWTIRTRQVVGDARNERAEAWTTMERPRGRFQSRSLTSFFLWNGGLGIMTEFLEVEEGKQGQGIRHLQDNQRGDLGPPDWDSRAWPCHRGSVQIS